MIRIPTGDSEKTVRPHDQLLAKQKKTDLILAWTHLGLVSGQGSAYTRTEFRSICDFSMISLWTDDQSLCTASIFLVLYLTASHAFLSIYTHTYMCTQGVYTRKNKLIWTPFILKPISRRKQQLTFISSPPFLFCSCHQQAKNLSAELREKQHLSWWHFQCSFADSRI